MLRRHSQRRKKNSIDPLEKVLILCIFSYNYSLSKSSIPEKEDDLQYCLVNLTAVDVHPLDIDKLNSEREEYLKKVGRENAQLLVNKLFELPGEGVMVELPDMEEIRIPREKPLPKERPPTKWEKFAKVKGIFKRKREALAWDEETESWRPRLGHKAPGREKMADWVVEVPSNQKLEGDPFEEKKNKKKEAREKQRKSERRNQALAARAVQPIAGDKKVKVLLAKKGASTMGGDKFMENLKTQIAVSKQSTASHGKFAPDMVGEPKAKRKKSSREPLLVPDEKEKNLKMLDRVFRKKKKDVVDITKAVNQHIASSNKSGKKPEKKKRRK